MILSSTEKILFQQVAAGEEQAFAELYHLFLPKLHPFILKLTRSELIVQEIVQETFIKIWLNRDRLSVIDNLGGWIYRIAANKCYDYLRSETVRNRVIGELSTASAGVGYGWMDSMELRELINLAIRQLPAQRQKIFRMSRESGMTIAEIAEALDLSPHTVKNVLVLSLQSIRGVLSRNGVTFFILQLIFIQ